MLSILALRLNVLLSSKEMIVNVYVCSMALSKKTKDNELSFASSFRKTKLLERIIPSRPLILHPSCPGKFADCSGKTDNSGTLSSKLSPQSLATAVDKELRFSLSGKRRPQYIRHGSLLFKDNKTKV